MAGSELASGRNLLGLLEQPKKIEEAPIQTALKARVDKEGAFRNRSGAFQKGAVAFVNAVPALSPAAKRNLSATSIEESPAPCWVRIPRKKGRAPVGRGIAGRALKPIQEVKI